MAGQLKLISNNTYGKPEPGYSQKIYETDPEKTADASGKIVNGIKGILARQLKRMLFLGMTERTKGLSTSRQKNKENL